MREEMTNNELIETAHCEDCQHYGNVCHCHYELDVTKICDHDDDSVYLWGHTIQYRAGFKDGILTALDLITRCNETPEEVRAYLTRLVNHWNRKD